MSSTTRSFLKASALALSFAFLAISSGVASAASISYGNSPVIPPGVTFLDVTEASGTDTVPLYGPPSYYSVGLDFNPSFTSFSTGGSADLTDGQLNFTVMSALGVGSISVTENGDYSIAGPGGGATEALAGAIIRATVTHVNGAPVTPIVLAPVNGSVSFDLPPNQIVAPWSLGLFMDVSAQLAGLGYGPGDLATKVDVAIDNTLLTLSEPGSLAFIAKKEFIVDIDPVVPEPSTVVLAGMALCGMGIFGSRRRS